MFFTKLKNKSGITIIALVITIVVILILAGVSVSMISGNSGIIIQAQGAKEKAAIAEVEELANSAYDGLLIKKMNQHLMM